MLLLLVILDAHDRLAVVLELASLQWLARVITNHVISWTIFDREVLLVNAILDKVVAYVDVSSAFARALLAILGQ